MKEIWKRREEEKKKRVGDREKKLIFGSVFFVCHQESESPWGK
jgi:hypothetical protein